MLTLRQPRLRADQSVSGDYGICGSHPHDPSRLSASLRRLALETHRAIRRTDGADSSAEGQQELLDLSERLEELHRSLQSENLDALARYVAALQREVCSRLI
jgi:hypothetical protein